MMDDINKILKLKEIDQLDAAILQFSKNTLASKKICATLLVGFITIILQLTKNYFDVSIYISCGLILFIFWITDSISYYYQRKLRIRMAEIVKELNNSPLIGLGIPLQTNEKITWKKSLFNHSQWFYYFGFTVLLLVIIYDWLTTSFCL